MPFGIGFKVLKTENFKPNVVGGCAKKGWLCLAFCCIQIHVNKLVNSFYLCQR
jgi:hypothetical protein